MNPSLPLKTTVFSALRRHRLALIVVCASAQLAYVLSMGATKTTGQMLVKAVFSGRYAPYALAAPVMLALGIFFNSRLKKLNWRWLEWSPFHVKSNLALEPIKARWVWAPYALMLAACMPLLAFFEELIFRYGTTNWVRGLLWGGLVFGVAHFVSLVSVRMVIYIAVLGVVLVQVYMMGGLAAVFVLHACYNLTALALLVAEQHCKPAKRLFGVVAQAQ